MTRDRGLEPQTVGERVPVDAIRLTNLPPQVSEWLPTLHEQLLPRSLRTVRRHLEESEFDPRSDRGAQQFARAILQDEVLDLPVTDEWQDSAAVWGDVDAEVAAYARTLALLGAMADGPVTADTVAQARADALAMLAPTPLLREVLPARAFEALQAGCLLSDVVASEAVDDGILDAIADQLDQAPLQTVTTLGTGRGPMNAGLQALAKGPARLHATEDTPTVVHVTLDGPAWENLEDRRTGLRSLAALSMLKVGFDVRIHCSPRLRSHLERRYEGWMRNNLGLTTSGDRSPQAGPPTETTGDQPSVEEAWAALADVAPRTGKLRLLGNLDPDGPRQRRDLCNDRAIDLAASSIDAYLEDLAARGLVTIERGRYNRVRLTPLGEVAVEQVLTPEYGYRHPDQTVLETGLTGTPQRTLGSVYRPDSSSGGGSGLPADGLSDPSPPDEAARGAAPPTPASVNAETIDPESWLADTGPCEDAGYVQWLSGEDIDSWTAHNRITGVKRGEGITVVDEPHEEFTDGRTAYISAFDDELLVIMQWGGPLATLARLAVALLSPKALNKVLTESAVGSEFDAVFGGEFEPAVEDVLQRGTQLGWLDEDPDYQSWRDRWRTVLVEKLRTLAEVANTEDYDQRAELFRDLHGLVAATTNLYNAADIDVTVNIRLPDVKALLANAQAHRDFLDFFYYTVPKNAAYGVHSVYRQLLETREEKLKHRLPVAVDPDDPVADLTASWVVSGPTATSLTDDLRARLDQAQAAVRDQVLDGGEDAPVLEIPVRDGTGYAAIKAIIEEYALQKGYHPEVAIPDVRRLVRVVIAMLGGDERAASPMDVVQVLVQLGRAKAGEVLSVSDIAYGLSQLPAERLLPALPPTARRMVATLLRADEPLGRSEIVERAGISTSSYDRHIAELTTFAVVEQTADGKYEAFIEPWWSPASDPTEPRTDQPMTVAGEAPPSAPCRAASFLWWAGYRLGVDGVLEADCFEWPYDYDGIVDSATVFGRWATFVMAHTVPYDGFAAGYCDGSNRSEWVADSPVDHNRPTSALRETVTIGSYPVDEQQTVLLSL